MKKHSIPNFSVLNNGRDQLYNVVRKNTPVRKNVKFIYTEKDLGEGLLEAGVPDSYSVGKQLQYSN